MGKRELDILSKNPKSLDLGLVYLKQLESKGKILEAYTIDPTREALHARLGFVARGFQTSDFLESRSMSQPTGVAIAEAPSIENVKALIENMSGATPEGIPFLTYLDYRIYPLGVIGKQESRLKGVSEEEVIKSGRSRRHR